MREFLKHGALCRYAAHGRLLRRSTGRWSCRRSGRATIDIGRRSWRAGSPAARRSSPSAPLPTTSSTWNRTPAALPPACQMLRQTKHSLVSSPYCSNHFSGVVWPPSLPDFAQGTAWLQTPHSLSVSSLCCRNRVSGMYGPLLCQMCARHCMALDTAISLYFKSVLQRYPV